MTLALDNCGGCSNSYPEYLYVRDHSRTLDGVIAYDLIPLNISTSSEPQQIFAGIVTANYFKVLGVKPVLGRGFLPEEDQGEGGHAVAVLGYTLWQQRFAADRSIIGKQISINRHPFTVIGVAPPAFSGTYGGLAQELWLPMMMVGSVKPEENALHGPSWMMMMGRLRQGSSLAASQAEMRVLGRQFADQSGKRGKRFSIEVASAGRSERGLISTVASMVPLFAAAAGVLLLIVCANLANLLMSRGTAREREIAIRAALGAGRGRIVRQLLTESILLAFLGAIAGVVLATLLA